MRASSSVRFPFWWLQGAQAVTTFSQTDSPPRDLGITWSGDDVQLSTTGTVRADDPQLCSDGNDVYALWRTTGSSPQVRLNASTSP